MLSDQPRCRPSLLILAITLAIAAPCVLSQDANDCDSMQCYLNEADLDANMNCTEWPSYGSNPPCYEEWSAIYCTCDPGYRMSWNYGWYYCYPDGLWEDDLFDTRCLAPCTVDAGPGVIAVNSAGNETDHVMDSDYVTYSCPTGYMGSGTSTVFCNDGVWDDHTQYTCECDPYTHCYLDRTQLDAELNCHEYAAAGSSPPCYGVYSQFYSCTCEPGYRKSGSTDSNFYCEWGNSGVQWSDGLYDVRCLAPCFVDAGPGVIAVDYSGNETDHVMDSGYVMYSCPAGYTASGTSVVVCYDGVWEDHVQYTCDALPCESAAPVDDDLVIQDPDRGLHDNGTSVTYTCPSGYHLSGSDVAICLYGNWSLAEKPYCSPSACEDSAPGGDMVILDPNYLPQVNGTIVHYSCPKGYSLNGNTTATCLYGNWSVEEQPFCTVSSCEEYSPSDGSVIQDPANGPYPHYTAVNFSCPDGYDLHGDSDMICMLGNWTAPPPYSWTAVDEPSCSASVCHDPPPAGDFIVMDPQGGPYPHGVEVQYSCPDGLHLSGSNMAQCINGTWQLDDGAPSCDVSNEVDASSVILFCGSTYFQVDIPDSMVVPAVRDTDLYFAGDPYNSDCRGFRNEAYITLNTSLTGCGTVYSDNNNMSYYQNAVESLNMDSTSNATVEYMNLEILITCEFERSAQLKAHFSTVNEIMVKKETGTFQYDFSIYESVDYSQRHNAYPVVVSLGSKLYFRVELLRSPGNLQIHLRSCHATPTPNYDDPIVYPIISDGCGVEDAAVRVLVPEEPTQADFEILSFRFAHNIVPNNPEVWIHCEVILCDADDVGSECSQGCEQPRSRRSIGTSYQRVQRMASGPIILGGSSNQYGTLNKGDGSEDNTSGTQNALIATLSLFSLTLFVCLVAMGVVFTKVVRRLQRQQYQKVDEQSDVE